MYAAHVPRIACGQVGVVMAHVGIAYVDMAYGSYRLYSPYRATVFVLSSAR